LPGEEPGKTTARAHEIVCARCGATITHERESIAVSGQHLHQFVNPSGMLFRIRCFAEAPGVAAVGESSAFFSWFPGHAWRAVVCAACLTHLGWRFEGEAATFHGLIADRIASGEV
jgi:hypothetical protein